MSRGRLAQHERRALLNMGLDEAIALILSKHGSVAVVETIRDAVRETRMPTPSTPRRWSAPIRGCSMRRETSPSVWAGGQRHMKLASYYVMRKE